MINARMLSNLTTAFYAMKGNKIRSALTALGIIFGVAAVIAMLSVGNGAQKEILDQIKLVGVNNIVIKPIIEQKEEEVKENVGAQESKKFSPGLSLLDVENIVAAIPTITHVSTEIELETYIIKSGIRRSAKLIGVTPSYFNIYNLSLSQGQMFHERQLKYGHQVCIIGQGMATRFFSQENPIGKQIKCGQHWLTIVGVLESRNISEESLSKLGIRDANMDVYTPLKTMLLRYENRALVTQAKVQKAASQQGQKGNREEAKNKKPTNYHQIDRLVIQVEETDKLQASADITRRLLARRHFDVVDYEITIPELLLKQQQRTKDIFNVVLGAIASISLVVGGIGIMNIMLASVLERIKEIGLRLSLGAKKSDIMQQFLFEALMISLSGGIIGIIFGVLMAYGISKVANIPTIISFSSILISFLVSASVGVVFGIAPARRAASQDPISSLRYE
jgi:putative ABC transport system permease protein